jgi:hypothetical protein
MTKKRPPKQRAWNKGLEVGQRDGFTPDQVKRIWGLLASQQRAPVLQDTEVNIGARPGFGASIGDRMRRAAAPLHHSRPLGKVTATGLARIKSGACCAAEFRPASCRLGVIRVEGSRGRPSMHFRYSPKS